MRSLLLIALALIAAAARSADAPAGASPAPAPPIGRLFFTPAERAALEDARRRNIRAEQLAEEASKKPRAPRSRDVTVTGVVLRSDGESFAWVNGQSVEGRTSDGLRVRHTAQPNKVVVYDPDKGRMVSVKVGQRADLTTGRVEETYESRKGWAPEEPLLAPETEPQAHAASRVHKHGGRATEPPSDRDRSVKVEEGAEPTVPATENEVR